MISLLTPSAFAGTCFNLLSNGEWMSYEEASATLIELGIKTSTDFKTAAREGRLPVGIPKAPATKYREDWVSWRVFLNREIVEPLPYAEARDALRELGIQTAISYIRAKKSGRLGPEFPKVPWRTYAADWISWGEFLGTGKIDTRKRVYASFEEISAWATANGVSSFPKWRALYVAGLLPPNFPYHPEKSFPDQFVSWAFLSGTTPPGRRTYREAKAWAIANNLTSEKEFAAATKLPGAPVGMPSQPSMYYRQEWEGWKIFSGRAPSRSPRR